MNRIVTVFRRHRMGRGRHEDWKPRIPRDTLTWTRALFMWGDWQFPKAVCPSDCSFISSWGPQTMLGNVLQEAHWPPCMASCGSGVNGWYLRRCWREQSGSWGCLTPLVHKVTVNIISGHGDWRWNMFLLNWQKQTHGLDGEEIFTLSSWRCWKWEDGFKSSLYSQKEGQLPAEQI